MEDKELKHEFELERVILFSDAIFAIIITIMILDVKLPEGLKHADAQKVQEAFKELRPKLIAYAGSFILVGIFWSRHLRIFKTIRDYDGGLIFRNLLFLFVVSLLPFAISTITSGLSLNSYWTVDIYLCIILGGFLAQAAIIAHIVKHKQKLAISPGKVEDVLKWKIMRLNFIFIPAAITLMVILNILLVTPTVIMNVVSVYAIALRVMYNRYYPSDKPPFIKRLFSKKKHTEIPAETTG